MPQTRFSFLQRDGLALRVAEAGAGATVLFQHGLGGDAAQVAEIRPDAPGWRWLTLECRGQGGSALGEPEALSLATFADDVWALAEAQPDERLVLGGISMGAAIALRLAVRHRARVRALILARPAWLFAAAPETMRPFAEVAALLASMPPAAARPAFLGGATAADLRVHAPDNLASLEKFFDRANPHEMAALLSRISSDGPDVSEAEAAGLDVPALVLGNAIDRVHPLAFAQRLAGVLTQARLVEVNPKATDRAAHAADMRQAIADFLEGLP